MKVTVALCILLFNLVQQNSCQYDDYSFEVTFDEDDRKCFKELNLDEEVIADEFEDNFKVVEGNPQVNKFIQCAWRKKGIINKHGNFNKREMKHFLRGWDLRELHLAYNVRNARTLDDLLDEAVNTCSGIEGYDIGDTVVKVYNCLVDYTLHKRLF